MMKLEEFMKGLRAQVDSFEEHWKAGMANQKLVYPEELESPADWEEQFLMWLEGDPE